MAGSRRHLAKLFRLKPWQHDTGRPYAYKTFKRHLSQIFGDIGLVWKIFCNYSGRPEGKTRFNYFLEGDKNPI